MLREEEELAPNLTSKEDEKLRKQIKFLFTIKDPDANKVLDRLNFLRRANGLGNLTKEEIMSKSLKSDIKKKLSADKVNKVESGIQKILKDITANKSGKLKILERWSFSIGNFTNRGAWTKDAGPELSKEMISSIKDGEIVSGLAICEYLSNKFIVYFFEKENSNSYHMRVVGSNAPSNKVVVLEARFPELKKKIIARPYDDSGIWRIKSL